MKACICYLSRGDDKTVEDLVYSLNLLFQNFLKLHPYNVIVFVEKDFPESYRSRIQEMFKERVSFKEIKFRDPEPIILDKSGFPWSYRNMSDFLYRGILSHLEGYDWYWRLDTDSFITSPIKYDVFQVLEQKKAVYGYVTKCQDAPEACEGAGEFFYQCCHRLNIHPKSIKHLLNADGSYNRWLYFNNFEIRSLAHMRQIYVQRIIDEVVKSDNIYKYRWGDHVCITFTLAMTALPESIHQFTDIGYTHGWFSQKGTLL